MAIKIIKSSNLDDDFFYTQNSVSCENDVKKIISNVKEKGDQALFDYTTAFDKVNLKELEVSKEEIIKAKKSLQENNSELYNALVLSKDLAFEFAKKQAECFTDFEIELRPGIITGQKTIPVKTAGIYTPAGSFPLFSSVIMGAMPAKASGVKELILCSPPSKDSKPNKPMIDSKILAVSALCGIDRVFALGGAQAIAAMAYGTKTVPCVDVIVGPGNKYVATAKKLVYGDVGIDLVAGPTEVLIIADDTANPSWVAVDLLAQAEHDADASSILLVVSEKLAMEVQKEVQKLVASLPENSVAHKSLANNSAIVLCKNFTEATNIANKKAPEHLELAMDFGEERDLIEKSLHNYGSLFVGHASAEILGDYSAGLNHTLPTSRNARFSGGLSVRHFLKTVTTLRTREEKGANLSGHYSSLKAAELIARAEGLNAHAEAAKIRMRN